jgi:hypothetical protein
MKFLRFLIFAPVIVGLCLIGVMAALLDLRSLEDWCDRQLDGGGQ